MYGGDGNSSDAIAQQQQQQQANITQGVSNVQNAFSGFDPAFYKNYQSAYTNAALPQFQSQYQNTLAQTMYGLANRGLSKSSAANNLYSSLNTEKTNQLNTIANNAQNAANNLQQQQAQEENTLIEQVQAGEAPSLAGQQALEAASNFSTPTAFPALGNLFSNWQNTYLTNSLASAYAPVLSAANFSNPYGGSGYSIGAPLGSSGGIT